MELNFSAARIRIEAARIRIERAVRSRRFARHLRSATHLMPAESPPDAILTALPEPAVLPETIDLLQSTPSLSQGAFDSPQTLASALTKRGVAGTYVLNGRRVVPWVNACSANCPIA